MKLKIKDGQGKVPVAEMRRYFERVAKDTASVSKYVRLDPFVENGDFTGYLDEQTDAMWFGFALGMRTAERIAAATFTV